MEKVRWGAGRLGADFILHPLIHTSAPNESSTKCGSEVLREKVWIKVCNLNFQKTSADFRSKRYGIGREKGRAIADSTLTGFISESHHSDTNHFLGRV
jgi:hypothetical protein